jgi:isocitrate dehydrogenase
MEHSVQAGDIWRMCQTKDAADPRLGPTGSQPRRATGAAAIFWLNEDRAHDANLIQQS